ncbi:MAG: type II toxin-antitoxin system HicB family antitoxin [Geminicoccaceae bacterium]
MRWLIEKVGQVPTRYSVVLAWDGVARAWSAEIPAFDGIATCGSTVEEALAMARELIELHIEYRHEHGEPLPIEDVPVQLHRIDVPV